MKKIAYIFILTLSVSCNPNSNNNDTTEEATKEIVSEETFHEIIEEKEGYDYDEMRKYTTRIEFTPSKFKENQIKENIYYVYYPSEIPFYHSLESDSIAKTLIEGTQVKFISKTIKEDFPENNVKGILWEVVHEGETGYVNSNYLTYIPYHKDKNSHYLELSNILHIVDSSIVNQNGFEEYMESYHKETIQFFERKIKLTHSQGYEGSDEIIEIDNMTVLQGLFFLDYYYSSHRFFELLENKIPLQTLEKTVPNGVYSETHIRVKYENNKLQSIDFEIGDGCMEWFYIDKKGNGITLTTGAGC